MIDLNQIADACRKTALRRGKINERLSHWEAAVSLRCELDEYTNSSEHVLSEHLPEYTEAQEELADIIIVCLTDLSRRKVDIEALIKAKLTFNQNRE